MTEQDKQALIKHFCKRDCGDAAENCEIMPCHEIELIQEFPTTEADPDTISRAKAIDGKICIRRSNGVEIYDDYVVPVEYLEQLPPAQPEIINCNRCVAAKRGECIWHNAGATYCSLGEVTK